MSRSQLRAMTWAALLCLFCALCIVPAITQAQGSPADDQTASSTSKSKKKKKSKKPDPKAKTDDTKAKPDPKNGTSQPQL